MKILILGGSGMLGHKVYKIFKSETKFKIYTSFRVPNLKKYEKYKIFDKQDCLFSCDVLFYKSLERKIKRIKPGVIINCIGLTKPHVKDYVETIEINSCFPHRLAKTSQKIRAKLIHISTDCVFSGEKGCYSIEDNPDPIDLYGRSKLLGEVGYGKHLTIRTSMFGRELSSRFLFLEWFLSQKTEITGFDKVFFSGLTTTEIANVLLKLVKRFPKVSGIIHLAGERISKYKLLCLLRKKYGKDMRIKRDSSFFCDRSLVADEIFVKKIKIPPIEKMIEKEANNC